MRTTLVINSDILNILKENNITQEGGVSYLLLLYYNLRPSYIPENLERKILSLGIVNMDYNTKTLVWYIPLFEEGEKSFEWVKEWMDLFKTINPERKGIKADVIKRMKKFFSNNPDVRVDEVIEATKNYLRTVSSPTYCKKSHKFIYEQDNSSMLLDYVMQLRESKELNEEDMI